MSTIFNDGLDVVFDSYEINAKLSSLVCLAVELNLLGNKIPTPWTFMFREILKIEFGPLID